MILYTKPMAFGHWLRPYICGPMEEIAYGPSAWLVPQESRVGFVPWICVPEGDGSDGSMNRRRYMVHAHFRQL